LYYHLKSYLQALIFCLIKDFNYIGLFEFEI
jgi:hypothetical protein